MIRGKHVRIAKRRNRHAGPLYEQILDVICSLPIGWIYVFIYGLGAAVGILSAVLFSVIRN